jgi:preprotein translocase subunit SecG
MGWSLNEWESEPLFPIVDAVQDSFDRLVLVLVFFFFLITILEVFLVSEIKKDYFLK